MAFRKRALHNYSMAIWAVMFAFGMPAGAHAFTIVTEGVTNPDGSSKFADPDEKVEKFANGQGNGAATSQGGTTFQFNVGPVGPEGMTGNGMPPSMMNRFDNRRDEVPGYPTAPDGR